MTDFTRNTRTLIVCFSLAIFTLIPLRFVEISQQTPEDYGGASVLGETQLVEEVVLPNAEVEIPYVPGQLEAPYDEVEMGVLGTTEEVVTQNCMSQEQIDEAIGRVNDSLLMGLYANSDQADAEIQWLVDQLCR